MLCVLASALPLPRRTHLNQGQGPTSPYEHLALSEKKVEAIPLPHDHVSVMLMLMLMLILAASLRLCSTTGQTRRDRLGDSLDDRATVSSTSPLSSWNNSLYRTHIQPSRPCDACSVSTDSPCIHVFRRLITISTPSLWQDNSMAVPFKSRSITPYNSTQAEYP